MAKTAELKIGAKAPDFKLSDADENELSLDQFRGKWVVLYFYPKDDTPGCTIEAQEFTAQTPEFEKLNTKILGISPDSCASHQKFINKYDLSVLLLSDPEHKALETYGAWRLKKRYGREYMGVARSTYLIDPEGVIRHIWPNVKAKGHADEVRQKIAEMNS